MTCRYCVYFDTAKERVKIGEKRFYRKCIIKNKDKSGDDDICEDFLIVSAFWCNKNDMRISLNSCISRHKNKNSDCKKCKQINELKQYVDERN